MAQLLLLRTIVQFAASTAILIPVTDALLITAGLLGHCMHVGDIHTGKTHTHKISLNRSFELIKT